MIQTERNKNRKKFSFPFFGFLSPFVVLISSNHNRDEGGRKKEGEKGRRGGGDGIKAPFLFHSLSSSFSVFVFSRLRPFFPFREGKEEGGRRDCRCHSRKEEEGKDPEEKYEESHTVFPKRASLSIHRSAKRGDFPLPFHLFLTQWNPLSKEGGEAKGREGDGAIVFVAYLFGKRRRRRSEDGGREMPPSSSFYVPSPWVLSCQKPSSSD